jgi:hypothetical protein
LFFYALEMAKKPMLRSMFPQKQHADYYISDIVKVLKRPIQKLIKGAFRFQKKTLNQWVLAPCGS